MSTETVCVLFGAPAAFLWIRTVGKGVILGRTGWIDRSNDALRFWLHAIAYGTVSLGLLVAPLLVWLGFRDGR